MIHAFRLLAGTFALATSVFVAEASGAELKVLSAGAMRAALQDLAPAFEAASGNKLKIEYGTAGDVEKKVAAGEDRKSTRLNSSHSGESRMPSSA